MEIKKVPSKRFKQGYGYRLKVMVDGERVRKTFEYYEEAENAYVALKHKSHHKRYGTAKPKPRVSLRNLQALVEADESVRPQARRNFDVFIGVNGDVELAQLTKAHVKKYVDSLNGVSNGTVNVYLSQISSILRSASWRYSELEDWRPPIMPWRKRGPGRDRVVQTDEIVKMLESCYAPRLYGETDQGAARRRDLGDLILLDLLVGAREGEILNLEQRQVGWDFKTLSLTCIKGGVTKPRIIPLTDTALDILRRRKTDSPRFFAPTSQTVLRRACRKVAEMSGVAHGRVAVDGWTPYDFRRTAATKMANSPNPNYQAIQEVMGHARTDQTATYAKVTSDSQKKVARDAESYLLREILPRLSPHALCQIFAPDSTTLCQILAGQNGKNVKYCEKL